LETFEESKNVVPCQEQALDCYQNEGAKVRVKPIRSNCFDWNHTIRIRKLSESV